MEKAIATKWGKKHGWRMRKKSRIMYIIYILLNNCCCVFVERFLFRIVFDVCFCFVSSLLSSFARTHTLFLSLSRSLAHSLFLFHLPCLCVCKSVFTFSQSLSLNRSQKVWFQFCACNLFDFSIFNGNQSISICTIVVFSLGEKESSKKGA